MRRDDVITGAQEAHQCSGDGGHARGVRDGRVGALEVGERALEPVDGRVPQPLVDQRRRTVGPLTRGKLVVGRPAGGDVPDGVGRRQVDRGHVDAEGAQVLAAGVDGASSDVGHGDLLRM